MRKAYSSRHFTTIIPGKEYAGGGFRVCYSNRDGDITVAIDLDGHGRISEGATNMKPSVESASIHASGAFRAHFGHWSGNPHEHTADFCVCAYDSPRRTRKMHKLGKEIDPDREFAPVRVAMPSVSRQGVVTHKIHGPTERECIDCGNRFSPKGRAKRCESCRDAAAQAIKSKARKFREAKTVALICNECGKTFDYEQRGPRAPGICLDCKDKAEKIRLADIEARQWIECSGCGNSFRRKNPRGRAPSLCESCKDQ